MLLRTPARAVGAIVTAVVVSLSACATPERTSAEAALLSRADDAVLGFAPANAALVPGLEPTVYLDDERGVRAEVPTITTARQLTSAMEVLRERGLREAAWAGATSVDISYRVIASGPGTVGLMVVPTWQGESGATTRPALVWYDAGSKRVFSSPALIQASQWAQFTDAVGKAAGRKVNKDRLRAALAEAPAPQGNGPMLGFDARGDLVAQFAPGVLDDKDFVAITVKADIAAPWLSELGKRAALAAQNPSVFDGSPHPAGPITDEAPPVTGADVAVQGDARPSTAVGPDCRTLNCVALTFDDGPGSETAKLVGALATAKAPATFFQLGQMVQANPGVGKQVASAGHEIGSHSFSHPNLAQSDPARLQKEIVDNATVLSAAYGRKPMTFRPPFGAHNKTVDDVVHSTGAAIIKWDVDTLDWRTRDAAATEKAAVHSPDLKPGSIVLMHDIHPSTVAAVPAILAGLQAKGVTLVTVSELSLNGEAGYRAGRAYCHGTFRAASGSFCAG